MNPQELYRRWLHRDDPTDILVRITWHPSTMPTPTREDCRLLNRDGGSGLTTWLPGDLYAAMLEAELFGSTFHFVEAP